MTARSTTKSMRAVGIRALALFIAVVGVLALTAAPAAGSGTYTSRLERNQFSHLAARWWQWGLQQPAATNPLSDQTGQFCANRQRGKIWFLAGPGPTDADTIVNRTCTIPAGKKLFFPLVNVFSGALPSDPPELHTVAAQLAIVAMSDVVDSSGLSVTVDGHPPVGRVLFEDSNVFRVVFPADNLFGVDAGSVLFPAVDAGYYALLRPLRPGQHLLHFTGQIPGLSAVDATYHLTIGPADDRG